MSRRWHGEVYQKLGSLFRALFVVCGFCFLLSLPVHAQDADISGTVRDTAGALIPNASVNLTNEATSVTLTTQTNPKGLYAFPRVQAGVYDIAISASGFRKETKVGITVSVADRAEVDFDLKVGAINETVTITAQGELLQTGDAVTGQVIDRTFINDLPLISRSAFDLAFLAPGVSQPPNYTYGQSPGNVPYLTGNNFVSNGSRNSTSDIQIDGTTTAERVGGGLYGFATYTPSVDAVQEFKVQQTNFSAEYGFTGGSVTNVVTRSGTNNFHGSAYDFLRNNLFDANNYFNNLNKRPLPPIHQNVFGGTIGGPVFKNKTFFFFDYEGTRQHTLGTATGGVPSVAEKTGDFGELCTGPASAGFGGGTFNSSGQCSNSAGQLWDPYSSTFSASMGGGIANTFIPFNNLATYASPGNPKLNGTGFQLSGQPGDLIDPVASKLMSYFPAPNIAASSPTYSRYTNFFGSGANLLNNDQYDIKIDQHFNDSNVLSAKYAKRGTLQQSFSCFGNVADPCTQGAVNSTAHVFSLNYDHIFSPATVLSVSYGYTRAARLYPGPSGNDPVKVLGMPSYITAESGVAQFPAINLGTYAGISGNNGVDIGTSPWSYLKDGQDTHQLIVALSHLSGRHELKFGFEGRLHRFNNTQPGTPDGFYSYSPSGTYQSWAGGGGDEMASFLTGFGGGGAWGRYEIPVSLRTQNFAWAGYAQDNFHVNKKLTVNVGLRYDLTMPETETNNELSWLDLNAVSPLQVPGLPTLHGGNEFATSQNRSAYYADYKDFQPRFGLAYRLNDKTVIRSGYGIYYDPSKAGANADVINSQGFSQVTNWLTTYQADGATPWGRLSNPWPNNTILPVTGSKLGLLTNVGGTVEGDVKAWNATPYEQSWSFGIQRSLPWNTLVEADYIGKKGTHLYFGVSGDYNLNHLGPQVEQYTAAQITALNTKVPNPFFGYIQSGSLAGPTVSQGQLDLPYPQFGSVLVLAPPWANSIYHAFQLRMEKRFSDGLQLLFTYVNSKSIDTASVPSNGGSFLGGNSFNILDPNDPGRERSLSTFDIPQTWQVSYVYQLPIGRGKHFGGGMNPVLNAIIGGWQTNGIWRFDDGQPLSLAVSGGQALPGGFGQRAEETGPAQINPRSEWVTKGYFASPTVFSVPAAYTFGNTGRTLSLRAPGTANASLSVFKEFGLDKVHEGMHLEYRIEAFNAFNHTQFCPPNTTVQYNPVNGTAVGTFGQITCQANSPREVQMALKLYF